MSSGDPRTRTRILEATWRLMEERSGQGVRMRDVAEAAGISRQAVYDHFGSRAELMVATARYGDEVRGLDERLRRDGTLAPGWSLEEAADLLWTMLSISAWESLMIERGWSTSRYVGRMQELTKRAFVRGPGG